MVLGLVPQPAEAGWTEPPEPTFYRITAFHLFKPVMALAGMAIWPQAVAAMPSGTNVVVQNRGASNERTITTYVYCV